jgi:hypothetical protein
MKSEGRQLFCLDPSVPFWYAYFRSDWCNYSILNGLKKCVFLVSDAYGADFGLEKGDLRQENFFYWDISV